MQIQKQPRFGQFIIENPDQIRALPDGEAILKKTEEIKDTFKGCINKLEWKYNLDIRASVGTFGPEQDQLHYMDYEMVDRNSNQAAKTCTRVGVSTATPGELMDLILVDAMDIVDKQAQQTAKKEFQKKQVTLLEKLEDQINELSKDLG